MPLQRSHKPRKILNVGTSGSGKTTLAYQFIERSQYGAYFVYDHDGQFCAAHNLRPAVSLPGLKDQLRKGFVVFDPEKMFRDPVEGFAPFCAWVYAQAANRPGTKLLFVDEIQDLVKTQTIDFRIRKIWTRGRLVALDTLATSQQYNMVHNVIRGQTNETNAFLTFEKHALAELADRGFDPNEIRKLAPGEFITRSQFAPSGQTRGRVF